MGLAQPVPLTGSSPGVLLPGDNPTPGEAVATLHPVLLQGLEGPPGPSPGTRYFPSTGHLTHSLSSTFGHTIGLGHPAASRPHLVSPDAAL